jgi:putative spermidine/putrescine transport system substrate-binding protein
VGAAVLARSGRRGAGAPTGAFAQATPIGLGTPAATPALAVPGFEDPTRWAGRTLHVGAWGGEVQDALREAIWEPFAVATGCALQEVITDYSRLRLDLDAGRPAEGVLVVDPIWAATALDNGYVQMIAGDVVEREAITPIRADAGSVPAFAYAMVDAFRWDGTPGNPPKTWTEWWDHARFPGPRGLQRGALGTFEFALLADGVRPDQLYPLDGARAIESLKRISGQIIDRWWDSGAEPVAWLSRGRVDFVSSWHYRVVAGQYNGYPIDLVWNQGLLVADRWVVLPGEEERDVAFDFLRYATTPEVQAALARRVPLGPTNRAAFDLLDARTAARLPTSPANLGGLIHQNVRWWADNNVEANQRFNNWLLGVPDASG